MPKINVFDLPLDVGWTKQKEIYFFGCFLFMTETIYVYK